VIKGLKEYCKSFTKRNGAVYDEAFTTRSRTCNWPGFTDDACCNFIKFDNIGGQIDSQTAVTFKTGDISEFGNVVDGGPYFIYEGPTKSGNNAKPRPLMFDVGAAQIHPNYNFKKWVYEPAAAALNRTFFFNINRRMIPPKPPLYLSFGKCSDSIDFRNP
jgi:hypothetical protein